jgi:hypothetical protein
MKKLFIAAGIAAMLSVSQVQADQAIAYTVVEGADIQTVAGQYDVTVEDIMITTGLETEDLEVGSIIYIPPKHARGFNDPARGTYLIAPGDDFLIDSRTLRYNVHGT